MATEMKTDILVIGSGPGGYSAAFRAADLGLKVTLVEADERLGGVCLIRGCIPSKALLHVAALKAEAREAKAWGLAFGEPDLDIDALRKWKDGIIDRHTGGLTGLCRRRGVEVVHGRATFESSTRVSIDGNEEVSAIEAGYTIVATGSRPTVVPGLDLKSKRMMDSTGALQLPDIPETLLVIGGGYIGLELGSVYAELGSKVTVVELTDGLLPGADRDLVKPLQERLENSLHAIHLKTKVAGLKEVDGGIEATLEGSVQETSTFSRVLMSVGRRPNSDNLGLDNTGVVVTARGFIEVDEQQRTADEHILAIGDVAGEPGLAHKAAHEGKVAAEVLAGEPSAFDNKAIPAVVFTDPEVAWCGLTENQAKAEARPVEIARFPWSASGRASTLGRNDGLTKLIIDRSTGRLLGVGICGRGAGELISEGVLAVEMAAVAADLSFIIHPHPTLSESMGIAAEMFLGTATDLYVPKRK
jgi:dihydrolipoamide dehydrogenase